MNDDHDFCFNTSVYTAELLIQYRLKFGGIQDKFLKHICLFVNL